MSPVSTLNQSITLFQAAWPIKIIGETTQISVAVIFSCVSNSKFSKNELSVQEVSSGEKVSTPFKAIKAP